MTASRAMRDCFNDNKQQRTHPLDRTNRSRLYHEEFFGFALKKLVAISSALTHENVHAEYGTESTKHGRQAPIPLVRLAYVNIYKAMGTSEYTALTRMT